MVFSRFEVIVMFIRRRPLGSAVLRKTRL